MLAKSRILSESWRKAGPRADTKKNQNGARRIDRADLGRSVLRPYMNLLGLRLVGDADAVFEGGGGVGGDGDVELGGPGGGFGELVG